MNKSKKPWAKPTLVLIRSSEFQGLGKAIAKSANNEGHFPYSSAVNHYTSSTRRGSHAFHVNPRANRRGTNAAPYGLYGPS